MFNEKKKGQNTWHLLLQDFMTVITFYSRAHNKMHSTVIWTALKGILAKNNYTVCVWIHQSLNDLPPVPLCLPQLQPPPSSCTAADSQSPAPSSELYRPSPASSTSVVKYLRDRSPRKVKSQHIQQRKILVLDKLRHWQTSAHSHPLSSDCSDWEQWPHTQAEAMATPTLSCADWGS